MWRALLHPEGGKSLKGGGEEVAVKILAGNTSQKDRSECLAEARLMCGLDHENIVKLKGLCLSTKEEPTQLLIVLEYCNRK